MKPRRAIFCKGCLQQLHLPIPIHGPLSIPLRIVGLRPSRMNPNMCNLCETMFKHIKKSSQVRVPLTILFADVRGYTTMSELADSPESSGSYLTSTNGAARRYGNGTESLISLLVTLSSPFSTFRSNAIAMWRMPCLRR